jgi:hypothetical protein
MGDSFDDREPIGSGSTPLAPRPIGSPLQKGNRNRRSQLQSQSQPQPQSDPLRLSRTPSPASSLPLARPVSATEPDAGPANNMQRAVSAIRLAMPFFQKLLPLLDGHVATAVSNVLTSTPPSAPTTAPAPAPAPLQPPAHMQHQPLDLSPVHDGIKRLQADQRELRNQIAENNTSLHKVEDRLDMVREATDRNTLEQQEFMEDLKNIGTKVNIVTLVLISLLLVSMLLNLVLYLHMQRVLP